ncbi:replication-associated recombination protein A [Ferroacidibacillus organovorans]|uniref:AAA+ ATPase domain-containing protein n=1 Tax=Ferroacidibacillus organovorans TaxID=1765683 RepID=A0A853KDH6_9BACL|nr:replication-associated recombination protein A [Ferroacidibacillus organovorans]KYP80571.1 hypothetical protein AYJ22_10930 [Ferroacidibacillus organovorans]OAG93460.1 hypothetical protein AYW79_10540 [Ferroacidibacillus organovorans]
MDESIPLAERMRPRSLDEFYGQQHLLRPGTLIHRAMQAGFLRSVILWGPPGVGKTTLAKLMANRADARLIELSAVSSGTRELREVFAQADEERRLYGIQTLVFIDEIHRYTKTQQDALLPAVERGVVHLIGSTTQNPRMALTPALLSRLQIVQLRPLTQDDLRLAVEQALTDETRGLGGRGVLLEDDARDLLLALSGGDVRRALTTLEWAVYQSESCDGVVRVKRATVQRILEEARGAVDESTLYDMLSAFGKSLRGSDSDAAVYWFMRMVDAGVDPRIPVRRMIVHASEDVGMANPQALLQAMAAWQALDVVGMPEARIPIAQAIVFVCESPKSNSIVVALGKVETAIRAHPHAAVPLHLRDKSYPREDDGNVTYRYPHDYPHHHVKQVYLPSPLERETFYAPSTEGLEQRVHPRKHGRSMDEKGENPV